MIVVSDWPNIGFPRTRVMCGSEGTEGHVSLEDVFMQVAPVVHPAVCDETQNLNETGSETFFRYQIFSRPVPRLFSVPIFFETGSETIKK